MLGFILTPQRKGTPLNDSGMLVVPESRSAIVGLVALVNVTASLLRRRTALSELRLFSSGSLGKTNVYFVLIADIRFIVNLTPLGQKAMYDSPLIRKH
jgi:hypothetical protein